MTFVFTCNFHKQYIIVILPLSLVEPSPVLSVSDVISFLQGTHPGYLSRPLFCLLSSHPSYTTSFGSIDPKNTFMAACTSGGTMFFPLQSWPKFPRLFNCSHMRAIPG